MADLKFFIDNFDKLMEDTKIFIESLEHDLKEIPQNFQNVSHRVMEKAEELKLKLSTSLQEVLSGESIEKDLLPELKKWVEKLEVETDQMFTHIKSAIDKAR